jgi:hypothetical protein
VPSKAQQSAAIAGAIIITGHKRERNPKHLAANFLERRNKK